VRNSVLILSLLLILTGCASMRPRLVQSDTVRVVTEVPKDSIVFLPADSSVLKAWFECDSLNHVIMTGMETASGDKVTQSATFDSGVWIVKAHVDSLSIYLKWKERHEKIKVTNTVEKVIVKKPAWLLWLAGIGTGAILILIILIILKFK